MPKDLSAQQVGTQRRATATEPKANVLTGRTKFPMSYPFGNSSRYGEITPFYYQHVKGDDIVPLQSEHQLRTYTMQSPMMGDLFMHKSYFFVPMDAIYPRNWERMQVNPDKGEDVPFDTRFFVTNLLSSCKSRLEFIKSNLSSWDSSWDTNYLRFIFFLESIFSNGSLFSEFNIHLSSFLRSAPLSSDIVYDTSEISFDTWFDTRFVPAIMALSKAESFEIQIEGVSYLYNYLHPNKTEYEPGVGYKVPIRKLLDLMRHNSFVFIGSLSSTDVLGVVEDLYFNVVDNFNNYPINLEIFAAYQMGCYQFFTDSKIDNTFSAQRYRDLLEYNVRSSFFNSTDYPKFFSQNGVIVMYDVCSGHVFSRLFDALNNTSISFSYALFTGIFNTFALLFNHNNSLKYGDYFVTGRVKPYGIGDVSVDTSGTEVNVIDITKKIQIQRFLNSVQWSKQKVVDYARDVLGIESPQIIGKDVPSWLGHQEFHINGFEVENTGANQTDQNSITTIMKTTQSKFAFECRPSNMGIIIGVRSFDMERMYARTFDRSHMKEDRFDDFIPEMQFIGDQPIFMRELNAVSDPDDHFAYALRYMEMKIRYGYVAGAFVEQLPSWAFVADNEEGDVLMTSPISADFIRSNPVEFDRFYASLTGYSLGSYFHFQHVDRNYQELTRDLVYAPEPLK